MISLIGKTFRRNKYGLSIWEDTITKMDFRTEIIDRNTRKLEFMVKGTSNIWYSLDEIVITNMELSLIDILTLQSREIHDKARNNSIRTTGSKT